MADLIDRKAAIDSVIKHLQLDYEYAWGVREAINALPSAESDRKTGRWERHYSRPNVFADLYWHCSCCGYKNEDQYANVYHKFCPHCGADMRGGENETD